MYRHQPVMSSLRRFRHVLPNILLTFIFGKISFYVRRYRHSPTLGLGLTEALTLHSFRQMPAKPFVAP